MTGDLNFFRGLQIKQSQEEIFVCQSKHALELVDKYGLSGSEDAKVPMSQSCKLDKDEDDQRLYRSMIGSLSYLTTILSVCLRDRCQSNLKESHMFAIKKIIKYIKYTKDFGLWFAGSKCNSKSMSDACS